MAYPSLQGRRLVLGVTGGIAAYRAVELLRLLQERGARVRVAMTRAAQSFVGKLTFEALTGEPVVDDVLALEPHGERLRIGHVALAGELDGAVVAPATADFMARTAHGRADDALGSLLLATRAPLVVAPAMEENMWLHPATQANLRLLVERGAVVVAPEAGRLASGKLGQGRLASLERIVASVEDALEPRRDLAGRRIVVTSGPTREPVDPVRYLTNRSSGRMGFAVARAARRRGAHVTLVHGPTALPLPEVEQRIAVETAAGMHQAVLEVARGCDGLIMAAAVADYTPVIVAEHKLKKSETLLTRVELKPTVDILADACRQGLARVVVGFAAETEQVAEYGRRKLAQKGAQLIVANQVGTAESGFDVATSRATLLFADGREEPLGLVAKEQIAERLLDAVAEMLAHPPGGPIE